MNLQQLEYILAIDQHRHFGKAAAHCFVTQATLSMMVKKLEEELDVTIFDRSKQPVLPTEKGYKLITQARQIIRERDILLSLAKEVNNEISGEVKLGIIPTLAPYLLPLFLQPFLEKYPRVKIQIHELTTAVLIEKLENNELDAGILATPLNQKTLQEIPLFYENFVVYASSKEPLLKKKYILTTHIDINRLLLLEEGHCLRSQVINLCALKQKEKEHSQLEFTAGSIETLKKMVETHQGITILPELAIRDFTKKQQSHIRYFKDPAPAREIGLVTYRQQVKRQLIDALQKEIRQHIPAAMWKPRQKMVVPINENQATF